MDLDISEWKEAKKATNRKLTWLISFWFLDKAIMAAMFLYFK